MPVSIQSRNNAVVVTLEWTDKRNALSAEDADVLAAAITEAGNDESAKALIVTGVGTFSAGGDLPYFAALGQTLTPEQIHHTIYSRVQSIIRALRDCPIPTIAAVDGAAIGLGMDIALACDMRFIGPSGFLMQGWARAGLITGTGGVSLLNRIAPAQLWPILAKQERIGGDRAVELGLGEVGSPDAMTAALGRVDDLGYMSRSVLGKYAALGRLASWPAEENFDRSGEFQGELLCSDDFRILTEKLLGKV